MQTYLRIRPHRNLMHTALYHLENINQKVSSGNEKGILLDGLSCLVLLGFSSEALINFIGQEKISDWKERDPFLQKAKNVCNAANLTFDRSTEPFKTIWNLKTIRDEIAHGKPKDSQMSTGDVGDIRAALNPWKTFCESDYLTKANDQLMDFQNKLYQGCNITQDSEGATTVGTL
ncbi:hypothetical protein QFX18_05215 [Saccharophagus degradans]|uniref:hypothetical protein n=1 Tax=Saccharophagus degradans TaxID=86304 RepID=UPI00247829AC|nr:hypothetical protein [Saccharophagus degradans]WGO99460.1 hypothetical protein QFX18_05215 [Saccharophagus degradans]